MFRREAFSFKQKKSPKRGESLKWDGGERNMAGFFETITCESFNKSLEESFKITPHLGEPLLMATKNPKANHPGMVLKPVVK